MLVKNEEHSDGGESRTQVVEHICPRDPYPAHRVTEQNERRHRREDRQIKDGKYGIERKCLHRFGCEEPDDREEQQRERLHVANNSEGVVASRYALQHNRVKQRRRDSQKSSKTG